MNDLQRRIRAAARDRGFSETVMYESLPFAAKALVALAHPIRWARYMHLRFALWSAVPGDVFENFQMDRLYVVTDVKSAYIEAVPVDGHFLRARPNGRPIAEAERYPRQYDPQHWGDTVDRWTVADDKSAVAARALVDLALRPSKKQASQEKAA